MKAGCIWWNDGSKRFYNLRYEYVYLRTEFEPLPKMNKPAWRIGRVNEETFSDRLVLWLRRLD